MSRQDQVMPSGGTPPVEVTVSGALDAATAPDLGTALDRALAGRPRELVIDLAGCPFVDAAAIAMILDAHRRAWRKDTLLTLRDPSPRVRRILALARVDRVLHITPPPPLHPDRRPESEVLVRAADRRSSVAVEPMSKLPGITS